MKHVHNEQYYNLIFIDGLPRVGKSVLSNIIPCFNNVEQIKFITILEHILPALRFKSLKKDLAKSIIHSFLSEFCYESYIGRNTNLRKNEQSSIYNYIHSNKYFTRLKKKRWQKYH